MKKNYLFIYFLFFLSIELFSQITFQNQSESLGLSVSTGFTDYGNGVSFFDFDNDGWDDITLTTENGQNIRFFKNDNGYFNEVTFNISSLNYQTKQVNWVDIDNDGDNDLFVTSNTNGNRLFENVGSNTFNDITINSGISAINMNTFGASWGDYNNDGYLDVFISNRATTPGNKLYKNNGNNTFDDVSLSVGIDEIGHQSLCSAFFDFNNDGFQDIYISNDKVNNANILYKNNGDGTFSDVSVSSGTDVHLDAMTVTIDDFNNDSWMDIYVTNTITGNVLLRNNGDETFTDIAIPSGTEFNSVGWGASFLDADNDMDLDLYVSGEFNQYVTNYLKAAFYINNNDETFTLNNSSFPGDERASYSNAIGDINNDGFPDILVSNNFENIFLWKNNTINNNNWLKINLQGVQSNKNGVGSTIEISIDGNKQYRYTLCGEGYLAQYSDSEFFGLGENTIVDYVKVTWLSGNQDIFYNVSANQQLDIEEGSSPLLSVSEILDESLVLYPIPIKNYLSWNSTYIFDNIEIFDLLGKRIKVFNYVQNNSVNLSDLKTGIYSIRFSNNDISITKKVIKE